MAKDSPKLSIACVIHSLAGGGAERVMAGLSSRLARRGHRVGLVTLESPDSDRHPIDSAVSRHVISGSVSGGGLLARVRRVRLRQRNLRESIDDFDPDVVLSFCDRMNVETLLSLRGKSFPVVVSERSDPSRQSLGPFWNQVRRRLYPNASCVVALTEASAEYLRGFSKQIAVIPSAVDRPAETSDRKTAAVAKTIVAAGRLEREKGFGRLLTAFSRSTENHRDWKLVVYGEGSQRSSLAAQSQRLGIGDRFELPGWIRPLSEPLSEATVFCLSSLYEGFPSVLLEAMSLGVPALSVDCESGPRAIVDHGRNGLLVEPSVDGLVEGISRMIAEDEERERMGLAGKDVVDRFSWSAMTDSYESLLCDVAASHTV